MTNDPRYVELSDPLTGRTYRKLKSRALADRMVVICLVTAFALFVLIAGYSLLEGA